jgi:hypothetical protein
MELFAGREEGHQLGDVKRQGQVETPPGSWAFGRAPSNVTLLTCVRERA